MAVSSIVIDVDLDENRIPRDIEWKASDSTADNKRKARAVMLSLWDAEERAALRIDLWTQKMMIDEMAEFYYQTFMTMADTYERATRQAELVDKIRKFGKEFYERFQELQATSNEPGESTQTQ